eukprot:1155171-Pelagomonas_calceolata.AAC.1
MSAGAGGAAGRCMAYAGTPADPPPMPLPVMPQPLLLLLLLGGRALDEVGGWGDSCCCGVADKTPPLLLLLAFAVVGVEGTETGDMPQPVVDAERVNGYGAVCKPEGGAREQLKGIGRSKWKARGSRAAEQKGAVKGGRWTLLLDAHAQRIQLKATLPMIGAMKID